MAANKNASLRYHVLDRCFQNIGRRYTIQDLLDAVNDALYDDNPQSSGIKERQLKADIRHMRSETGFQAPIATIKEGKQYFYRYEDPNFSIVKRPLSNREATQLKNALSILQRFEGTPPFEWVSEVIPLLNEKFDLQDNDQKVLGFESNIDYSGYHYIAPLFDAIQQRQTLQIHYRTFQQKDFTLDFHPYYLKSYNNRWFVFGRHEALDHNQWIIPLDRIQSYQQSNTPYQGNCTDWEAYFYDFIGVSKAGEQVQTVTLQVSAEQTPYLLTKPLHPSQKHQLLPDGGCQITLQLIPNYELEMQLLTFGEKVKVLAPQSLVDRIQQRLTDALAQYK